MMGGWVAIVSNRKLRIALFEFAWMMPWLARQCMYRVSYRTAKDHHARTIPEVHADCESRLVWAGLRRGFQDDVALSGTWQLDLF